MAEAVSLRLIISTIIVLGGVGLALIGRERYADSPTTKRD